MAIQWTGLFANTGYSSANNKTQDDAVTGMQDTLYVTGPGYGAYEAVVKLYNSTGALVATVNVSGGGGAFSAPPPARFVDNGTTYSYSLEVVRGYIPTEDADGITIRLVGGASKRYPSLMTSTPSGDVAVAGAIHAPVGISSFLPGQTAGVPDTASLTVSAGVSQRVALPTGTAFRFDWSGYGPFAFRFGSSSVVAVATDFPGSVGLPQYFHAPGGATHIAVYGDGGGTLKVTGGTAGTSPTPTQESLSFSLDTLIANSNDVSFLGDSITEGKGQGGTTISKGSWVYRAIDKIKTIKGGKYSPISYGTALPPNLRDNDINRDTRWNSTAGWILFYAGFAGNLSNGDTQGACFRNATTTNPLTLTPGVICDSFEVYLGDYPGNGQLTFQGSGGPLVAVDANKVAGWSKVKVPCAYSLSTNTLTIIRTGGGGVNVLAVRAIDSQRKSVAFHNLGIGYSRAYGDWYTTTTFDDYTKICTSPGMDLLRPSAAIIALGTNDAILGTTTANYILAITNLVNLIKSSAGDNIAFASPPPPSDATQRGRIEGYMAALQTTFPDIPLIDFYNGVFGGTYQASKMTDAWHPNSTGSDEMAQFFATWLTSR